jgi:hypothetical protein
MGVQTYVGQARWGHSGSGAHSSPGLTPPPTRVIFMLTDDELGRDMLRPSRARGHQDEAVVFLHNAIAAKNGVRHAD